MALLLSVDGMQTETDNAVRVQCYIVGECGLAADCVSSVRVITSVNGMYALQCIAVAVALHLVW